MQIGAQVRSAGGPLRSLERGIELGADVIQIFTQSPRMWRPPNLTPEVVESYLELFARQETVRATFCHASYLINLASPHEEMARRSVDCLVENLVAAARIESAGLILHLGSHLGGGFTASLGLVTDRLLASLAAAEAVHEGPVAALLIENTAGAGGTVGRSFEELARVLEAVGGDRRLGFCLDTQHLFASGVGFGDLDQANAVVVSIESSIGIDRLRCIHLNDSKVALGARLDRHENLGEGEIGESDLGWLLSHPMLDGVPALLEVPGAGEGPRRQDLERARSLVSAGVSRRRAARATTRQVRWATSS